MKICFWVGENGDVGEIDIVGLTGIVGFFLYPFY